MFSGKRHTQIFCQCSFSLTSVMKLTRFLIKKMDWKWTHMDSRSTLGNIKPGWRYINKHWQERNHSGWTRNPWSSIGINRPLTYADIFKTLILNSNEENMDHINMELKSQWCQLCIGTLKRPWKPAETDIANAYLLCFCFPQWCPQGVGSRLYHRQTNSMIGDEMAGTSPLIWPSLPEPSSWDMHGN